MKIKFCQELHYNHPAPMTAREHIKCLDGVWKCNGRDIVVPYAPETELSRYEARGEVLDQNWDGKLCYEVRFEKPKDFTLSNVRLHFGAVDQVCDVFVNDRLVGGHHGGYLAFSFDITEVIKEENVLRVEVTDTLSHAYPYGKQRRDRGGMWYTPVSGIWKSVWLENVPATYVTDFRITPDLKGVDLKAVTNTGAVYEKRVEVDAPHVWTPDDPYLYPMEVSVGEDVFHSYFALRTISIQDINGVQRVCLNNQPVFLHGVLDQGYWPDGLYTPSDVTKYDDDILAMKDLGFNLLRKHCKVEPSYFYTACDRLGMLVCQDMVNSGTYRFLFDTILPTFKMQFRPDTIYAKGKGVRTQPFSKWRDAYDEDVRKAFFHQHCKDTQKELYNYPCVIMYTIFNEGWGQFDSDYAYRLLKGNDGTRIYDSTSGWFAQKQSDFDTEHVYFRNKKMRPKKRPMFLKECGGYSMKLDIDLGKPKRTYGYGECRSAQELTNKIRRMYDVMVLPAISKGLCGCIYTQVSDVEDEINGLYSYDRTICKVVKEQMRELAAKIKAQL